MFRQLLKDQSGLTTIEILTVSVVLVLLAVISYASIKVGVKNAATSLGNKIEDTTANGGSSW